MESRRLTFYVMKDELAKLKNDTKFNLRIKNNKEAIMNLIKYYSYSIEEAPTVKQIDECFRGYVSTSNKAAVKFKMDITLIDEYMINDLANILGAPVNKLVNYIVVKLNSMDMIDYMNVVNSNNIELSNYDMWEKLDLIIKDLDVIVGLNKILSAKYKEDKLINNKELPKTFIDKRIEQVRQLTILEIFKNGLEL